MCQADVLSARWETENKYWPTLLLFLDAMSILSALRDFHKTWMSEPKYCNIFLMSGLDKSDVIHHVEERLERIMWTMGSPRPTGVYSVEWSGVECTGLYRSIWVSNT